MADLLHLLITWQDPICSMIFYPVLRVPFLKYLLLHIYLMWKPVHGFLSLLYGKSLKNNMIVHSRLLLHTYFNQLDLSNVSADRKLHDMKSVTSRSSIRNTLSFCWSLPHSSLLHASVSFSFSLHFLYGLFLVGGRQVLNFAHSSYFNRVNLVKVAWNKTCHIT